MRGVAIKYQDPGSPLALIIISKSSRIKAVLQPSQSKLIICPACFGKRNMTRFESLHPRSLMHLAFEYNPWILSFSNDRDTLYQRNPLSTARSSHILSLFLLWNYNLHLFRGPHHYTFFIHIMDILLFNSILCNMIIHQLKPGLYNIRIFGSDTIFLKSSNELQL